MYAQARPTTHGVTSEMAIGQLGQLAVVVGWQIVADLTELLVDDREVVDQPLGGRCDRPFLPDRMGEHAVRVHQDATVLDDARLDVTSADGGARDPLRSGQRLGVLFETLQAEELGEDRFVELDLRTTPPPIDAEWISERLVRCSWTALTGCVRSDTVASAWSNRPLRAGHVERFRRGLGSEPAGSRDGPSESEPSSATR